MNPLRSALRGAALLAGMVIYIAKFYLFWGAVALVVFLTYAAFRWASNEVPDLLYTLGFFVVIVVCSVAHANSRERHIKREREQGRYL